MDSYTEKRGIKRPLQLRKIFRENLYTLINQLNDMWNSVIVLGANGYDAIGSYMKYNHLNFIYFNN